MIITKKKTLIFKKIYTKANNRHLYIMFTKQKIIEIK